MNSPSPRPVDSPRSPRRRGSREGAGEGLGDSMNSPSPPPGRFAQVSEAETEQGRGQARASANSPIPRSVPSPRSLRLRGSRERAGESLAELSQPSAGPFAPLSEAETEQGRASATR